MVSHCLMYVGSPPGVVKIFWNCVMVVQSCKCTKHHRIVHFKMVNLMSCEFYHNAKKRENNFNASFFEKKKKRPHKARAYQTLLGTITSATARHSPWSLAFLPFNKSSNSVGGLFVNVCNVASTSCFQGPVRGDKLSFCSALGLPIQPPLQMRSLVDEGMTGLRAACHSQLANAPIGIP